jgi:hypothetical protein
MKEYKWNSKVFTNGNIYKEDISKFKLELIYGDKE